MIKEYTKELQDQYQDHVKTSIRNNEIPLDPDAFIVKTTKDNETKTRLAFKAIMIESGFGSVIERANWNTRGI